MSVFFFAYLFPNSSETANPNEQKFWGIIPLGMQMVLGKKNFQIRPTFRWKSKKNLGVYGADIWNQMPLHSLHSDSRTFNSTQLK